MPLNVRRFFASAAFVLFGFVFTFYSQTAPTSAEIMRERVAKAKAFIVVKNYNAAIYELENIRRETTEPAILSALNVLLMHSYLEQGDYKRAQTFLDDLYKDLKSNKPNAATNYYAAAGQVVKGARTQVERYRGIGLNIADRNLPLEALLDVDKMRETLEKVVEQTKTLGADKKQTGSAVALLEEATVARVNLARDDYDANRWKQEHSEAREMIASSGSIIVNAVEDPANQTQAQNTVSQTTVPNNTTPPVSTQNNSAFKPVPTNNETVAKTEKQETPKEEIKKPQETVKPSEPVAQNNTEPRKPRERLVVNNQTNEKNPESTTKAESKTKPKNEESNSPLEVGSLIEYATKRVNPVYPPTAKSIRQTGVVKVEVVINEEGDIASIGNTSGPSMLKQAAVDALRKWKFKPFNRDGQPVKATGFVNFNFNL